MKKLLFAVVAILVPLLSPAPALADTGERIETYAVTAVVQDNGRVEFTERIAWDFGGNEKHGIFRQLPLLDDLGDGTAQNYDLEVSGVLLDGEQVPWSTSVVGAFLELKIGDPEVLVTGVHEYTIDFSITNAMTRVNAGDVQVDPRLTVGDLSLYWDFVGDGWAVPIDRVTVEVTTPAAPIAAKCTFGGLGSTTECRTSLRDEVSSFAVEGLPPAQFVTVSMQLPAAAFTAVPPPDITDYTGEPEGYADPSAAEFATGLKYGAVAGVTAFFVVLWLGQRRRNSTKTARVIEAVRFEPPPGLRPAEVQAAWKGGVDTRGFTATLLDLTTRGIISAEVFDPGIFSGDKLRIKWLGSRPDTTTWEQRLLEGAFLGESERVFDTYVPATGEAVKSVSSELLAAAHASGRRNARAYLGKLPFLVAAGVLFVLGFLLVVFVPTPLAGGFLAPFLGMALVASLLSAWRVPKVETEQSAEFLSSVLGFRKVMDTDSAAARREFAQRSGLSPAAVFATLLPLAVVLEVDEAWGAAFPDLTPDDLAPYGLGFVGVHGMHDFVETSMKSVGHATTAPGKGGSGAGGGSAGGGGGGGGGGSW